MDCIYISKHGSYNIVPASLILLVFRVYAALAVILTDVTTHILSKQVTASIHVHKDGHFAE